MQPILIRIDVEHVADLTHICNSFILRVSQQRGGHLLV